VFEETFNFPASILPTDRQWLTVDGGGSLKKYLFIKTEDYNKPVSGKSGDVDAVYTFHAATFTGDNFEDSLNWLKRQSYIFPEAEKHIAYTGVTANFDREAIEKVFGIKAVFVDEFRAQGFGFYVTLKHLNVDEYLHPQGKNKYEHLEIKLPESFSETLNKIKDDFKEAASVNQFPALFFFCW